MEPVSWVLLAFWAVTALGFVYQRHRADTLKECFHIVEKLLIESHARENEAYAMLEALTLPDANPNELPN